MKDATNLELFRHTLTALKDIARFLKHMFYMRVSDVDAAFPLLPIAPRLWRFMMFIWYGVQPGDEASMLTWLYILWERRPTRDVEDLLHGRGDGHGALRDGF